MEPKAAAQRFSTALRPIFRDRSPPASKDHIRHKRQDRPGRICRAARIARRETHLNI
jgi:hypothetical protein